MRVVPRSWSGPRRGSMCALPASVASTIELVMTAVWLGWISIFAGEKVHDASSGKPEQDIVTNIGAVSDEALTGVMVVTMVPDWPG